MLKTIHLLTAVTSISLFFVRGIWMLTDSAMLTRRWVKIAPHINDTILLLSAVMLVIAIQQYPFSDAWLTAKVIALVCYILLGMVALKWGKTKPVRAIAWVSGLCVFLYIVSVAMIKSPWGLFA